ncbi:hypothetical protein O3M35_005955 [Rhynocoris fuscipes]|uniref:Uncharacterized protein n=1 Tax=Rhynocoris fuscipes TaxID=488301 RepID=A0AAW1DF67_9HEMI
MDLIEILWKQDVDMGFSVGEWSDSNNLSAEIDEETVDEATVKLKEPPKLKEKEKVRVFSKFLFKIVVFLRFFL